MMIKQRTLLFTHLSTNVVAVAQSSELLLAGGVPAVEDDLAQRCVEGQRVHFHAHCRHVLLLEFSGSVSLHESGLAHTSVTHQDKFKFGSVVILNTNQDKR